MGPNYFLWVEFTVFYICYNPTYLLKITKNVEGLLNLNFCQIFHVLGLDFLVVWATGPPLHGESVFPFLLIFRRISKLDDRYRWFSSGNPDSNCGKYFNVLR